MKQEDVNNVPMKKCLNKIADHFPSVIDIIKIYNEGQGEWQYCGDLSDYNYLYSNTVKVPNAYNKSINDLILDPEYNLIPTLEKSDEYNKAFWEWMYEKSFALEYYPREGSKTVKKYRWCHNNDTEFNFKHTPQMLLGYNIQFIKESMK